MWKMSEVYAADRSEIEDLQSEVTEVEKRHKFYLTNDMKYDTLHVYLARIMEALEGLNVNERGFMRG
jgi:hypothetical protein